jgi:LuxR family maltose regulon positive regulatory protein
MSALAQALSLAEPEGFIRIFLDEGEPMREVIRIWGLETGRNKNLTELQKRLMVHADKVLKAFPNNAPELPIANEKASLLAHQPTLVDPLSARELEVLHLIAEGLSNDAIAEIVSFTGTVKVHLNHLW